MTTTMAAATGPRPGDLGLDELRRVGEQVMEAIASYHEGLEEDVDRTFEAIAGEARRLSSATLAAARGAAPQKEAC